MSAGRHPADPRIAAIVHLTGVAYDAAQIRMASATAAVERLREQILQLDRDLGQRLREDVVDPARIAGADIKWQVWVERRRRQLMNELASARAAQEDARARLKTAFGRNLAATQLPGATKPRG